MRSGKHNAAVEMRWAELLDENMPQELHKNIELQKAACSEIVASKVRKICRRNMTDTKIFERAFYACQVSSYRFCPTRYSCQLLGLPYDVRS